MNMVRLLILWTASLNVMVRSKTLGFRQCQKLCMVFGTCKFASYKRETLDCQLKKLPVNHSIQHTCSVSQRSIVTRKGKSICVVTDCKSLKSNLQMVGKTISFSGEFSQICLANGTWMEVKK